jgi:hypothetical protein
MAFEDRVITKFEANIDDLKAKLQQISGLVGKTAGGMQNLGGPVVQRNLQQTSRATDGLRRNLSNNNRELHNSATLLKELQSQTNNTSSSFRMASRSIQTGTNWLDKFSIQADRASMMMWKFTMAGISVKELGVITGVTAAGMGLMLKKMVDSFSIIDRVERQFGSIYKSAELGNGAVAFLTDAAAKIRYSITEVLDAGRLLAMEGFAPKDLVYDMADLAAGVNQEGITIVNATRAFVDATNGQFRRLKETFQITREDAMKFAPDAFSGPNNQISNQAKATEAIIKAIRAKYSGMNEATMQTIQGQLSNVDDAIIKAVAPLGEALAPTLFGWFNKLFEVLGKIEKFGKSDLGKVVAQIMLFTTVSLAGVSAIAMLGAAVLSLMGIFAAYKVFMSTRTAESQNIIKAEMELMAVTRDIAALESERSIANLAFLKARLGLLKATIAEEKARVALFNAERSGTGVDAARRTWGKASDNLAMANAAVAVQSLPLDIIKVQDELNAAKEEEALLEGAVAEESAKGLAVDDAKLGTLNEQLLAQKGVTEELVKQKMVLDGQLRDAEALLGKSVARSGSDAGSGLHSAMVGNINAQSRLAEANRPLAGLRADAAATTEALTIAENKLRSLEGMASGMAATESIMGPSPRSLAAAFEMEEALAQARAEYEDAITASRTTNAALATAETTAEEAQTAALAAQVTYETELEAALAARPSLAARYAAMQEQINRLKAMEARTELEIVELGNIAGASDQRRLELIRQRIAALETEAGLLARQAATERVRDIPISRSSRFGSGFLGGAGMILEPLIAPVRALAGAMVVLWKKIIAMDFAFVAGSISGAVLALAAIVGVGWELYGIFKYNADAQQAFSAKVKESTEKLKDWTNNLPATATEKAAAERVTNIQAIAGKLKVPVGFNYPNPLEPANAGSGKPWDVEGTNMSIGKQVVDTADNLDQAKDFLISYLQTARALGIDLGDEWRNLTAENIRNMSAENLRLLNTTKGAWEKIAPALPDEYSPEFKGLKAQADARKEAALKYLREQQQRTDISDAQKEEFKKMANSANPARAVENYLNNQFKSASDAVPDLKNIQDAMEAGLEAGKDDAQIQAELLYTRNEAQQKLDAMNASLQAQREIGIQISKDDQERVDKLAQQLSFLQNIEATYKAIVSLRESGKSEGLLSSAGMSNLGYVFGGDNARDSWTAAMGEKDPKKRQQLMEDAFKSQLSAVEGATAVDLSNTELGPNATPGEKAAAARQKAAIYRRDFQRKRDEVMNPAISHLQKRAADARAAGDTKKAAELDAQVARAQQLRDMIGSEAERKAQTEESGAVDTLTDDKLKQMQARRDAAATGGASARSLAQMDMQILNVKMQQAKAHKDITEQMNLQVQAAQVLKGLAESALSDEEAKLSFMQTQADQGLISQETVDGEKRRLAQMYTDRANAAAKGSAEYYSNMQKALQLLSDETSSEWDGIVGKILGAPSQLLEGILSEGGIARRFGSASDLFGMNGKMQAEIVSQSNRELLVRVNFDSALSTVDSRIRAAMPAAINVMGQQLVGALSN